MSSSNVIVVIAHWKMEAASVDRVLSLVDELRTRSLQEPGCLGYEVLRSVGAPDLVVLMETYAGAAAIEAHRRSAHYQELVVGRILPLLVSRQVQLLQPAE